MTNASPQEQHVHLEALLERAVAGIFLPEFQNLDALSFQPP